MNIKLERLLKELCEHERQPDVEEALATGVVDVDGNPVLVSQVGDGQSFALTAMLDSPDERVPLEVLDEQLLVHNFRSFDDAEEIRFSRPPGPDYLVAASLIVSMDDVDSGEELAQILRAFNELAEGQLLDMCAFALAESVGAAMRAEAQDQVEEADEAEGSAPVLHAWHA